jgi:hypothetical protein
MAYYVTNENSFLDIKNAHLRVTGNVHTDVLKVGSIGFQPAGSNISGTVNFTNVTTGVSTSSNLDVGGTLNLGTIELSASTHTLDHITARGNVTSTTVQFDNATTGLVTTANVEVGGELTVTRNVTADYFVGDGSNITGISSTLQAITDSGNVTSNTIQFSNAITGFVTTANIEVGTANLFVDTSSSRLGIGTTTPDNTLHISGTQNQLVQIQNTSDTARLVLNGSSGTGGDLIFKQAGTTTWGIASIGDSLHFLGDDSTTQTRMTINNAGIVTTPSRPAFYAWDNVSTRRNHNLGILMHDSTTYNIGSHYNTSTGRFLTPVAGTYIFAAVLVHDSANALSSPIYSFYVDGGNRRDIIEGTGSHNAHHEQHGVYIVNLNANQSVDIRSRTASDITFINGDHGAYYRNCFQGALLG